MKKILLINPPLYYSDGIPHSLDATVPPLGPLYIASYINKYSNDFNAEIIDVGVEGIPLNDMKERILMYKPYVIGIYSMTPQLQGALELAKFIKYNINENITMFLGGPHISADTGFIDRYSSLFDYAIIGEGEKTFLDSINKLASGEEIPRIIESEIFNDIDSIPFPDRKLIIREKYRKSESMLFSRGCPYRCYYCSRPSISNKVRYRSVKNLIEEIKLCYNYCDGHINFQDDTFTLNRKKVVDFCNEVEKENLKLHWECNTRMDLVDPELIGAMKRAGCELIHFGIESGNERVRKEIILKGNFTNQRIYEVFEMCKLNKIKIACYFMIGHPTETKEELSDTRNMILKSGIDVLGLSIPFPFPGSRLYGIALQEGVISTEIIDQFAEKKLGEGYAGNYPIYVPKGIEREYLFQMMKDINRKFYFSFRILLMRLMQDIISPNRFKSDIIDFYYMILHGTSIRKPYKNKKI